MKNYTKHSKYLAFILRHTPDDLKYFISEDGWIEISKVLDLLKENNKELSLEELNELVDTNAKQRFAIDGNLIRANQGHTIDVKIDFEIKTPPSILYHGTSEDVVEKIKVEGIKPMLRQFVHLSDNIETATQVGQRHGKLYIFEINTEMMIKEGYEFKLSKNGVWLIEEIYPRFL